MNGAKHTVIGDTLEWLLKQTAPMLVQCIKPWRLVAFVNELVCIFMCILPFHDLETRNAEVRQVLVIRGGTIVVSIISGHAWIISHCVAMG